MEVTQGTKKDVTQFWRLVPLLALSLVGCGAQKTSSGPAEAQTSGSAETPSAKAFANYFAAYQADDKQAGQQAIANSPDPAKAKVIEGQASMMVAQKVIAMGNDAQIRALPQDQRLQALKDVLQKATVAKERMRKSHYQAPFQPQW